MEGGAGVCKSLAVGKREFEEYTWRALWHGRVCMGNGFAFLDIVLFAAIAAFLVLRLRGFLIASSFFGRHNLIAFVWARILRIYPALIVATIISIVVIG